MARFVLYASAVSYGPGGWARCPGLGASPFPSAEVDAATTPRLLCALDDYRARARESGRRMCVSAAFEPRRRDDPPPPGWRHLDRRAVTDLPVNVGWDVDPPLDADPLPPSRKEIPCLAPSFAWMPRPRSTWTTSRP